MINGGCLGHLPIAAIVAVVALTTSVRAADDAVLHLSYVEIHDRILPTPNVTRTDVKLEVRLQTSGKLQQQEERASGRNARGGKKLEVRLGKGWRVAGANQLINVTDYDSYQRAILVTVSGTSCSAQIGYNLKPGFHDYQYRRLTNGERATARAVTASGIVCSIQ